MRVWLGKNVIVLKCTISSIYYSGMENTILYRENIEVLLGDASDTCETILTEISLWGCYTDKEKYQFSNNYVTHFLRKGEHEDALDSELVVSC